MDLSLLAPTADVRIRPCRHRARVRWGDHVLADSSHALRVDGLGVAPTLWFPWADVRTSALTRAATVPWQGVETERYDAPGPLRPGRGSLRWSETDDRGPDVLEGTGLVVRVQRGPVGLERLAACAVFDHDRATVELLDGDDRGGERSTATTRFPNWGDVTDLVEVLENRSVLADPNRPVVEGSQLLGQAILAAMRRSPGRRVVSSHMLFLRAAAADTPLDIALVAEANGRTFDAYRAQVDQAERRCAAGTLLLGTPSADVVSHQPDLTGVPGPSEAVPYDMGVAGRQLRVVEAAYTDDPAAPVGPPTIDAWVRFADVPDDAAVHAGLLAQFTGHMSIAAALRAHAGIGQREAHRTISTAINGIALSFHAEPRVDGWILYRHDATVVADGMLHSECRVHDESGVLLASFSVDAMIRPLAPAHADHRTAL